MELEYDRLPIVLKRYSFEEKMRLCCFYSISTMTATGTKGLTPGVPFLAPWEIEALHIFCVKATNEYQNQNFKGKNLRVSYAMINCIRNYNPPQLESSDPLYIEYILSLMGISQFPSQESIIYNYYRYNYIFTYNQKGIDIPALFYKKFGITYEDFLVIGHVWRLMLYAISESKSLNHPTSRKIFDYFVEDYGKAINQLCITRTEFCSIVEQHTNSIDDYLYSLRPSYSYPFIEYQGKIHLAMPHLLSRSVTRSLLYRLTQNDNTLRTQLGKTVVEDYVRTLFEDSELYDEVIEEKPFVDIHRATSRTPDIMCGLGNQYLFVETKSMVPRSDFRLLDKEVYDKTLERLAGHVQQLYNAIQKFPQKYNFFTSTENSIDRANVWGIVALLKSPYIRPERVYVRAAKLISIDEDSEEYKWLINHIKVVDLYEIEKQLFVGAEVIGLLKRQIETGQPFDFSLIQPDKSEITNRKLRDFQQYLVNMTYTHKNNLIKRGIWA